MATAATTRMPRTLSRLMTQFSTSMGGSYGAA
jgi:hypothetical protein